MSAVRIVALIGFSLALAVSHTECAGTAQASYEDDVLALSRMIVSEAGYSPGAETFAILHVLEWRRTHLPALVGLTLSQMGRAYCSGFGGLRHTRNPHVLQAQALPAHRIPTAIKADVRAFLEGRSEPSPCPGAVHWRDRRVPARWEPLRIRCNVPTQNVYFRGEP